MPAQIRWTDAVADHDARVDVLRRAWHGAYSHIFTASEIDAVFRGDIGMSGDWTRRRTDSAGTLVADVHGEVVGLISLGILEHPVGEVAALYVVPEFQGSGIGRQLWDAGLGILDHRHVEHVEVWTLADAPARGFYEHLGCALIGETDFSLGDHVVPAVGYRRALGAEAVRRDTQSLP